MHILEHQQDAAGALDGCRDIVSKQGLGALTIDFSVEALTMLESAMLAQAQHCMCEKVSGGGEKWQSEHS